MEDWGVLKPKLPGFPVRVESSSTTGPEGEVVLPLTRMWGNVSEGWGNRTLVHQIIPDL